jgi:hypothetical protein
MAARRVLANDGLALAIVEVEDLVLLAIDLDGHVAAGDR